MIRKSTFPAGLALEIFTLTLLGSISLGAQTFTVIHNFGAGADGDVPQSPLLLDSNQNLYGATVEGPPSVVCPDLGCGTVFQLAPNADGTWGENILYSFDAGSNSCPLCMYNTFDEGPVGPLAMDTHGNLYGTATGGGARGHGTAFKLTLQSNGRWTRAIVHNFSNGWDGGVPIGLVYSHGHVYGATEFGGAFGSGVVFDLNTVSASHFVVHAFGQNNDGSPGGWLTVDATGNIYGNTADGGSYGFGTVFKLTPNPSGSAWTYTDLYDFTGGSDGAQPNGFVIQDADGNLYGTALNGGITGGNCGNRGCGTIFQLTPQANGSWSENTLYAFQGSPNDGQGPNGGVTFDLAGNLVGATGGGGSIGLGTLFKLTPSSGGQWTETVIHDFSFEDGAVPIGGLVLDGAGNLYGVTAQGGSNVGQFDLGGVAFQITP